MLGFFSALFMQKNTIKEEDKQQSNKKFAQMKKEVLLTLKELEDKELDFVSRARLDIEKLDKILKDNEAVIELSFGRLPEEAIRALELIKDKAIEKKNYNKAMTDDYVIQRAIQNLK